MAPVLFQCRWSLNTYMQRLCLRLTCPCHCLSVNNTLIYTDLCHFSLTKVLRPWFIVQTLKNSSFTLSASSLFRPEAFQRDKTSELGRERGGYEGGCAATEGRRGLRNWDGVRTKATMGSGGWMCCQRAQGHKRLRKQKAFGGASERDLITVYWAFREIAAWPWWRKHSGPALMKNY